MFGPRREVGPQDVVGDIPEWQLLRRRGVPTTALDDNVHFLPARSELGREDALRAWTATAHAAGFMVLGYATPYVSMTLPSAAADSQAGLAQGLFVQGADGRPLRVFFSSGEPQTLATIDLTHPKGFAFFQSLLKTALDLGYDGWMHDFGEYLPPSAPASDASVISADKRADRLDAQVALAVGQAARLLLADGTELTAERGTADAGNPAGLAAADDLAECALCFAETAARLRANGALAAQSDLTLREVRLHAQGPVARRIRWEVIRLP